MKVGPVLNLIGRSLLFVVLLTAAYVALGMPTDLPWWRTVSGWALIYSVCWITIVMVDSPNPNQVPCQDWVWRQEVREDIESILWKMSCSMSLTKEELKWIEKRPRRAEGEYD
jgi:hypothetical protein